MKSRHEVKRSPDFRTRLEEGCVLMIIIVYDRSVEEEVSWSSPSWSSFVITFLHHYISTLSCRSSFKSSFESSFEMEMINLLSSQVVFFLQILFLIHPLLWNCLFLLKTFCSSQETYLIFQTLSPVLLLVLLPRGCHFSHFGCCFIDGLPLTSLTHKTHITLTKRVWVFLSFFLSNKKSSGRVATSHFPFWSRRSKLCFRFSIGHIVIMDWRSITLIVSSVRQACRESCQAFTASLHGKSSRQVFMAGFHGRLKTNYIYINSQQHNRNWHRHINHVVLHVVIRSQR